METQEASSENTNRKFFTKRRSLSGLLIIVSLMAIAALYFQRGNLLTFLGGVGVPPLGSGATLLQRPSGFWDGTVSQSIDKTINVYIKLGKSVPLSSAEAIIHFDPAFIEVKDAPKLTTLFQDHVKASYDNNSGTVTLAAGEPYPGTSPLQENNEVLFASFDIKFKQTGDTTLRFDYGSGRESGTSHVVVTDDQSEPVDILDHAESLPIQILSPVPRINTQEQYNGIVPRTITISSSTDRVPMIINGRGFDETTQVLFKCFYGNNPTVWTMNPSYTSSDGTSVMVYIPQNGTALNDLLGGGCPNTGTLYPSVIGVQTQYGTTWYKTSSGNNVEFKYVTASSLYDPSITSDVQSVTPGSSITVAGKNFQFYQNNGPTPVQLINKDHIVPLTNIVVTPANSYRTTNQLTATVPTSTPAGVYDIQIVQNMSGKDIPDKEAVLLRGVVVAEAPEVVSVSPSATSADFSKNLPLQIIGHNFGDDVAKIAVALSGPESVTLNTLDVVQEDGDSILSAALPKTLSKGTYNVAVSVNGVTDQKENALVVTEPIQPTILAAVPSSLESGYPTGSKVAVNGNNLQQTNSASWKLGSQEYGTTFSTSGSSPEEFALHVDVPTNLPLGKYALNLALANGQSTELNEALTVVAPIPTPHISTFTPASVTEGYDANTSLVIDGVDFGASPTVSLAGPQTYALSLTETTTTHITAALPAQMEIGVYKVAVTSQGKTGSRENAFEVKAKPVPVIGGIAPVMLDQTYAEGTNITLNGSNFYPNTQVRLKNTTKTYELNNETQSVDGTQIKATLSQGVAPGVYDVEVYSSAQDPIGRLVAAFTLKEVPLHIMAPAVVNTSDARWSTKLSATWTLPAGSAAPQYYQYRVLDNGNEIRKWDAEKIGLVTSVTAKGLTLMNGHAYTIEVRGVNIAGVGEVGKSGSVTTRSANLDYDANEKVGLSDLGILGKNVGRTDKPMADINQSGLVSFDDLGILLSLWNP